MKVFIGGELEHSISDKFRYKNPQTDSQTRSSDSAKHGSILSFRATPYSPAHRSHL